MFKLSSWSDSIAFEGSSCTKVASTYDDYGAIVGYGISITDLSVV